MKLLLVSLFSLIGFIALSQDAGFDNYLIVTVDQLNMREEPNNSSKIIGVASKNNLVKVLDRGKTRPKTEIINGVSGNWIKVEYDDKKAYIFDGYLEGNIKIANDSWDGEYLLLQEGYFEGLRFSPGLNWYAIYSRENGEFLEEVSVNIEYKINRGVVAGNDLYISTNKPNKSTILIGTQHELKPGLIGLPIGKFSGIEIRDKQVIPSPLRNETTIHNRYFLKTSTKGITREHCKTKYYLLHLHIKEIDKQAKHIQQIQGVSQEIDCSFTELFWYGDINGDDIPDYIFSNRLTYSTTYKLYLSTRNDGNVRLEKVATFIPSYIPC